MCRNRVTGMQAIMQMSKTDIHTPTIGVIQVKSKILIVFVCDTREIEHTIFTAYSKDSIANKNRTIRGKIIRYLMKSEIGEKPAFYSHIC